MTTELTDLIRALEEGGKSDGRGFRVVSYDSAFKGKEARLALLKQLKRLENILEDDYLGEDQ